MARREDWPERLATFLDARRERAFAWGSHDCVTMAADWIIEASGVDPIEDLRGQWSDEIAAVRLIASLGGLRLITERRLGAPISRALAQRGDLVLHDLTGRDGLGICIGAEFAAPGLEGGIVMASMEHALMAWRI